jgi:transcriptional regulator of arginine metabolism
MKTARQRKILEIIEKNDIGTQEELVALLEREGLEITQATISRDIRELGITKVSVDGRTQRYVTVKSAESGMNNRLLGVLRTGFVSMDMAGSILVIKTSAGMAMAVAASIDALRLNQIVGSIAGDDTIFCALRSAEDGEEVMARLAEQLSK